MSHGALGERVMMGAMLALSEGVRVIHMSPDSIVQWLSSMRDAYPYVGQLIAMMVIDIATGMSAAFITRTLNSSTGWNGMIRKAVMLLLVGTGLVMEPYAGEVPVGKIIAVCFTVVEALSIVENAGRCGVPIPVQLIAALEKMRALNPTKPLGQGQGSVINVQNAQTVEVHDQRSTGPTVVPPIVDLVKAGDSVVIKSAKGDVVLDPIAVAKDTLIH